MEQNKVLMVVVSVAFFLAAVVGVGVALLYPRGETAATGGAVASTQTFDPIEYVRRPETAPLVQDPAAASDGNGIVVYGQKPEAEQRAAETAIVTTPESSVPGDSEAVVVQRPATPADTTGRGTSAGADATRTPSVRSTSEITSSPAAATPSAPSAATPSAARTTTPATRTPSPAAAAPSAGATGAVVAPTVTAPPSASREIRVTEYWIQLIASPSYDRVDQARARLTEYSLGARITTRDVEGTLYYRLRVGPYATNEEAGKFLEWIRAISGFEGAYISEEYPTRTVSR